MGAIDQKKYEARRLIEDKEYMSKRVQEHNELLLELNKKTLRIIQFSQMYGKITLKEYEKAQNLGTLDQLKGDLEWDFDPQTKEILNQIKKDNEEHLKREFSDFSYLTVEPETKHIVWSFIICIIINVIVGIWAVANNVTEDGGRERYGRY